MNLYGNKEKILNTIGNFAECLHLAIDTFSSPEKKN